jgi:hypothetical protein
VNFSFMRVKDYLHHSNLIAEYPVDNGISISPSGIMPYSPPRVKVIRKGKPLPMLWRGGLTMRYTGRVGELCRYDAYSDPS